MPIKLDNFDKEILYELSTNCRIAESQIAKKIKKSKQFVNYRILRLIEEKVILSFQCRINPHILGFHSFFTIFFRFKNVTEDSLEQIKDYLIRSKEIGVFQTYIGIYDLSIAFASKDILSGKKILDKFLSRFREYISDYGVFFRYMIRTYPRKYLLEKESYKGTMLYEGEYQKIIKLDKTDTDILHILLNNARISYVDLAARLKINIKTVIKKIKDMLEKKIIGSFSIHIDAAKIGFQHYLMFIDMDTSDEQLINKLNLFLDQSKEVTFAAFNIEKSIHTELYVKTETELQVFVNKLRMEFSDNINNIAFIRSIEEPKEDFSVFSHMSNHAALSNKA
ncbi:MAG: Lrp/AsnC family transcriptional regulator [Nanoarchaeota archaeon]